MENKYLGYLNHKEFTNLNDEEKNKCLLDNGLLEKIYTSSCLNKTDELGVIETYISRSKENLEYEFKPELAKDVYEFLLKHYASGIGADLIQFKIQFENEIFTLSNKKKRKKGLIYFDAYFQRAIGDRQIGLEYNANNEIVPEKRFKTLFNAREDLIYQLRKLHPFIIDYLLGLKEKFDRKLFETDDIIQNIFSFENNLSILIYLNKLFGIEDENLFSPKPISLQIYEKYPDEFASIKQLEFIEQKFNIPSNLSHSYVSSLFLFFKDEVISIPAEKKFRAIIIEFFNTDFNRLKVSDSSNEMHQKRIKSIKTEWSEF
jgi:hypothetical protein